MEILCFCAKSLEIQCLCHVYKYMLRLHLGSDQPHLTGSVAAISGYHIGWCRSEALENFSWIRAFCLLLVYFVCPFPFYLRHVLLPGFKLYPLGRLLHRLGPSVLNKRFSCWISVRVAKVISGLWHILRVFWFVSCHLKLDPPNETLTNSVTERNSYQLHSAGEAVETQRGSGNCLHLV